MINGLDILLILLIVFFAAKYRKQKALAETWKNTAREINLILNEYKTGNKQ